MIDDLRSSDGVFYAVFENKPIGEVISLLLAASEGLPIYVKHHGDVYEVYCSDSCSLSLPVRSLRKMDDELFGLKRLS